MIYDTVIFNRIENGSSIDHFKKIEILSIDVLGFDGNVVDPNNRPLIKVRIFTPKYRLMLYFDEHMQYKLQEPFPLIISSDDETHSNYARYDLKLSKHTYEWICEMIREAYND